MKHLIPILFLLAGCQSGSAEPPFADEPADPQLPPPAEKPLTLLCVGDSNMKRPEHQMQAHGNACKMLRAELAEAEGEVPADVNLWNWGMPGANSGEIRADFDARWPGVDGVTHAVLHLCRNDLLLATDECVPNTDHIVSELAAAGVSVRIVGAWTGDRGTEACGGEDWTKLETWNADRAAKYPGRYVDVITPMMVGDGSDGDVADLERCITPRSLRADSVHANRAGNELWTEEVW